MNRLLSAITALTLGAAVVVAGLAPANGKKKTKKTEVEGTWKLVKGGKGVPKQIVFSGNKFIVTISKERVFKGTFKLNTKENPSWMDMKILSDPLDEFKGKVALCIYKFDDGLVWCSSVPGRKRRPQQFANTMGDARLLLGTYKKVKK